MNEAKTSAKPRSGGQKTAPGKSKVPTVPMGGEPNRFLNPKGKGTSKSTKGGQGVQKHTPWRQR